MKGQRVLHSRQSDEWATPPDLFAALDREFHFDVDAAATADNALCEVYWDQHADALVQPWATYHVPFGPATFDHPIVYCNPPYSRCLEFLSKAAQEASRGATVVCLVPARTDTRWFHALVWDADRHQPRPGVEVRFVKGRLRFGGSTNGAPFPSLIVVFRPR